MKNLGNIKKSLVCLVLLAPLSGLAQAERFDLESALIESATAKTLGGSKESGELSTFFSAQKKMLYQTLSDLGISLESLPPDVRRNLERFQTTNFEAFKLFSLGLNAQDEGKFAEAKAFFEKAVELDPNFELAGNLSFAMPNTNASGTVQLQSTLAAAVQTATASGKSGVGVDLSGAIAALQSGQNVVVGIKPETTTSSTSAGISTTKVGSEFTSNPAGSASNYAERQVVGVSYGIQSSQEAPAVFVASTNEWILEKVETDAEGLVKVGDANEFQASRGKAGSVKAGSLNLSDGTTVSWGIWQSTPSASASVSTSGTSITSPYLGPEFQYMIGQATREMPSTGTATFNPAGGFLNNVSGSIGVDFVNRNLRIDNLGFKLGELTFANLNGSATYSNSIASGFFKGNYSAGSCSGCTAFSPNASAFTGNFLGKEASGLMFSSILSTGTGTVSGVHAFSRSVP